MKLSAFRSYWNRRGGFVTRSSPSLDPSFDGGFVSKSPSSVFWLVIHGLCCLISLILGFRFSHLFLFFIFSTSITNLYTTPFLSATNGGVSQLLRLKPLETTNSTAKKNSRVVVGRHGIRIRPWPHPNPIEVMRAHQLLVRVQKEQKSMYGVRIPKTVIVVTPTYVRTFQALHLTGVMHSLMLVPYDLIWIVVEAGGISNETASFIAKSGLKTIHIGFNRKMPNTWEDRHKLETKMRLHALRVVREKKLDGIVMFGDDSNMHSMELFDEIQSVKWVGALSIGILAHSGNADELSSVLKNQQEKPSMPIQGPSCDSSEKLVGWHIYNTQPYAKKTAVYIDEKAAVMPSKMEWSGFVLNSKLLWKESVDDKPAWVKDLNLLDDSEEIDSPLSLVKDPSMVEPLGSCGRHVLLWWLRVEARADSKFPHGWIIKSPLEITVPSKRTPWADSSSELPVVNKEAKSNSNPRGSKSKSKGKQEPKAFDGVKVSATR
ncbi:putative beta-1,4-xylosyltransferase IRX14H [Cardamine amara subsp. amara]|uniref:Glycosyltransferases n=1 Tax=Cardamine amara subsp. amara TaxID=228776 RepID=A0ABD0ZPF2_CARAN